MTFTDYSSVICLHAYLLYMFPLSYATLRSPGRSVFKGFGRTQSMENEGDFENLRDLWAVRDQRWVGFHQLSECTAEYYRPLNGITDRENQAKTGRWGDGKIVSWALW